MAYICGVYYQGGPGFLQMRLRGLIFGRTYFRGGGIIVGNLRYFYIYRLPAAELALLFYFFVACFEFCRQFLTPFSEKAFGILVSSTQN